MVKKAVLVHAGRRDNYQVALALKEGEMLEALVTDFYLPGENNLVQGLFKRFNKTELLKLRYIEGLPSQKVKFSFKAMALSSGMKILGNTKLNPLKDAFLGRKARNIAKKNNSAILSYSTYAKEAFKDTKIKNRILFQLHPHPLSVRKILKKELELCPQASSSLLKEYELSLPSSELDKLVEEPLLANGWMCASSFTAKTLAENGIELSKIKVIPYGVDLTRYTPKQKYDTSYNRLNIIFVGSFNQRKGLSYLLEAVKSINNKDIYVTLVGRGFMDQNLLSLYPDLNITTKINVSHKELIDTIHQSDIMVLPSIVEGFAQVILECMACGLPVITTDHTAGPDIITQGEDGFIVPIRNPQAIAEKLQWFINNKNMLPKMGNKAINKAATFTWERFRAGIRDAYKSILLENES